MTARQMLVIRIARKLQDVKVWNDLDPQKPRVPDVGSLEMLCLVEDVVEHAPRSERNYYMQISKSSYTRLCKDALEKAGI